MAFERIDGRGILFKNLKKREESHSDFQGDVLLNGEEYWINGWRKVDKNGNKYISLSFKPKAHQKPLQGSGPVKFGDGLENQVDDLL